MLDHEILKLLHILTHMLSPRRKHRRSISSIHPFDVFTDLSIVETSNSGIFEILLNRPNLRQIFFCFQDVNGLLWRSPKRAYEIPFAHVKCIEYFIVGIERADEISLRVSISKDKNDVYHKAQLLIEKCVNFFLTHKTASSLDVPVATILTAECGRIEVAIGRDA